MVTMPRGAIEEQHDAMLGVTMLQYLGASFRGNKRTLPDRKNVEGSVRAELYRGLWIARCPHADCSDACAVTTETPVYACPACGAGWFKVLFPDNKAAIEAEVMKRPAHRNGNLIHANWNPYGGRNRKGELDGTPETMYRLRQDTVAMRNT